MRNLIILLVLVGIQHASFSQATSENDTLCFSLAEIRLANEKLERGKAALSVNKELNVQIHSLDSINALDSLIRLDFINSIATYQADSVTSVEQLGASQEQTKIFKGKANRNKWIFGGGGVVVGALIGVLVGVLSK